MSRVSTAEMYDDKDVITQICKLKDGLNSALGGIIADIDIVNNELVIDWADGESIALPLPSPTGISSIAGSVSGGNLTITIYMTDGSSHAFTCPLNGMATEAYVDVGLATKADASSVYTKAEITTLLNNKFNSTSESKTMVSNSIETFDLFTADEDGVYLFCLSIHVIAKQSTIAIGFATTDIGQTFIESSISSNVSSDDQRANASIIVTLDAGDSFAPNIYYRNESGDTDFDSVSMDLLKQVVRIV